MNQRQIGVVILLLCSMQFNFLLAQDEDSPVLHIVCDGVQQDITLYNEDKATAEFKLSNKKIYSSTSIFEISNLSKTDRASQNRSFFIYKDDTWVMDIPSTKKNKVFCIKSTEIIKKLQPGMYEVYTIAIPSDPEIAKLVKPGRVKVCSIIIE